MTLNAQELADLKSKMKTVSGGEQKNFLKMVSLGDGKESKYVIRVLPAKEGYAFTDFFVSFKQYFFADPYKGSPNKAPFFISTSPYGN